jgi:DNA-binding NarL/FixJ family response regulator
MSETIKVVICEDHQLFMKGVIHSLSHKNDIDFIGEAENGWKLLQLLKHVTPDVILLDINMPIMDGKAALLQIRKTYPDIKVIMLTMHDEPTTIIDMMKIGANAYLVKNCGEEKIYEAIISCYKTGRYLDDMTSTILLKKIQGKIPEIEESPIKKVTEEKKQEPIKKVVKFNFSRVFVLTILTVSIGIIIILMLYFVKNYNNLDITSKITYP